MKPGISPLARALAETAHDAGRVILKHYAQGTDTRSKADESPVTAADEDAEKLILERLAGIEPGTPIVAEEEVAAGRLPKVGRRFFLVDPLDGTKEFISKNGEFTVNIALIEDGHPVCGVVLAPAKSRLFLGDGAHGAFELAAPEDLPLNFDTATPVKARRAPEDGMVAVASRSHRDEKTDAFLAKYKIANLISAGSSLKLCLVATGEADIYPRIGRTMEWDIAAGHAVLAAAGGRVTDLDGKPLLYGKTERGFDNPHFVAFGLS
jgi:3'(2'), 5'-bisphosphate nucleotidase